MSMKKIISRLCAGILISLPAVVYATGAGFYMGINLGQSNTNNIARDVVAAPQTINGNWANYCIAGNPNNTCATDFNVTPSNTGLAERLFMGVNINEYAGIEMGYAHFAASEYDTDLVNKQIGVISQDPPTPTTAPQPIPTSTEDMLTSTPAIRESAIDLGVKIMYPFQKFGVFGKVGMSYTRRSMSGSLTNQASDPTAKRNGTVNQLLPEIAIGASYDFTPRWVVDFSMNRVLAGANNFKQIDFYAVGISYHIVTEYCGQFIC